MCVEYYLETLIHFVITVVAVLTGAYLAIWMATHGFVHGLCSP